MCKSTKNTFSLPKNSNFPFNQLKAVDPNQINQARQGMLLMKLILIKNNLLSPMSSQSIPSKKGWFRKSSIPFWPNRCSILQHSLEIQDQKLSSISLVLILKKKGECRETHYLTKYSILLTSYIEVKSLFKPSGPWGWCIPPISIACSD